MSNTGSSGAKLELIGTSGATQANIPTSIELPRKALSLGRSKRGVDVILDLLPPTNTISRKHAEIVYVNQPDKNENYLVHDLNSTNGVFVNDIKISQHVLRNGDIIQLGGAAGVPFGTKFSGVNTHIRYRFVEVPAGPSRSKTKKRRPPSQEANGSKSVQNVKQKIEHKPEQIVKPTPKATLTSTKSGKPSQGTHTKPHGVADGGGRDRNPDSVDAAEALRVIANGSPTAKVKGLSTGHAVGPVTKETDCASRNRQKPRRHDGGEMTQGQQETAVSKLLLSDDPEREVELKSESSLDILRDAMCGLCLELLLDAGVLPCSHSFCRSCWTDYVEERGTTCPVCSRKFHSSERIPRRCLSLDLVIASLVEKVAGPTVRTRWQERRQALQARAERKRSMKSDPSVSREEPRGSVTTDTCKGLSNKNASSNGKSAAEHIEQACVKIRNIGRRDGIDSNTVKSSGKRKSSKQGGVTARQKEKTNSKPSKGPKAREVLPTCEGCNETGHSHDACPHRSDSALQSSDESSNYNTDE